MNVRIRLTLDPDVAELLQQETRRPGTTFEETVNHRPFVVTPRAMGLPAGLSYDNIDGLIEALEAPDHR